MLWSTNKDIPILGSSGHFGPNGQLQVSRPPALDKTEEAKNALLKSYVEKTQKPDKTAPISKTTGTNTNLAQGSNLNPFLGAESQIEAGNRLNTIA